MLVRTRLSLSIVLGLAACVCPNAVADVVFQSAPELSQSASPDEPLVDESGSELIPGPHMADVTLPPQGEAEGRMLDLPAMPEEVILAQREEPIVGVSPYERPINQPQQQQQSSSLNYGQPLYTPASGQNTLLPFGTFGSFGPSVGYGVYPGVSLNKRWLVSVAQTADYVTNLALPFTITPSNATTHQNDAQFQTNVYAQYLLAADEKQSLSAYFNYYQSLHPTVQTIDLWAYTTGARYARILSDRVTGILDYNYTYYLLDHNSLESTNRVGPSLIIKGQCNSAWIASYYFSNNNFFNNPNVLLSTTQTSTSHLAQLQRIQYLRRPGSYAFAGYAYGRNNAVLDSWSYDLNYVFGGYSRLFGCCNRNQLFLFGSYGSYNFSGFDVIQTDTKRHDNIYTLQSRVSHSVSKHLSVFAQYIYFNSQSNVVRQTFQSNLYSIGVIGVW